jgi:hypothetical protein
LRRLGWKAFESTVGHVQAFDINPLRRLFAGAGLRISRVRWGGHITSQIAHTAYVIWLSTARGLRISMSVESLLSQANRGFLSKMVGFVKDVVAILIYAETSVLGSIPGAAAHITAVRHGDC